MSLDHVEPWFSTYVLPVRHRACPPGHGLVFKSARTGGWRASWSTPDGRQGGQLFRTHGEAITAATKAARGQK